jgi:hypothetical protein
MEIDFIDVLKLNEDFASRADQALIYAARAAAWDAALTAEWVALGSVFPAGPAARLSSLKSCRAALAALAAKADLQGPKN